MAERCAANYFTPLVGSRRGVFSSFFFRSEAQPRRSAEDCIRLNCAVVFYTTVNGGILEKASGALGVNTLSKRRPDDRRQE